MIHSSFFDEKRDSMDELALHILDIVQNSLRAQATDVTISVTESRVHDKFEINIKDNGLGMSKRLLKNIKNPFITTRQLRKVGLGIPFLTQICEECEGNLTIQSVEGEGTVVCATMRYSHIDRLPLGSMAETLTALIMGSPETHFTYTYACDTHTFRLDTDEVKAMLDGVPIQNSEILAWLKAFVQSGESNAE